MFGSVITSILVASIPLGFLGCLPLPLLFRESELCKLGAGVSAAARGWASRDVTTVL